MNIADKCPCLGCMERTVGCHSSCEKYKSYMKESEERKKAIKKYLEKDTPTGITVMTRLQGYKNSKGNIKSKGDTIWI